MRESAVYHLKSKSYKFQANLKKLEEEISGLGIDLAEEKKLKKWRD